MTVVPMALMFMMPKVDPETAKVLFLFDWVHAECIKFICIDYIYALCAYTLEKSFDPKLYAA